MADVPAQDQAAALRTAESFIMRLAETLHAYGTPAHRLEEVVVLCAQRLGTEAHVFATPTGITFSFGPRDNQRVSVTRVEPGEVNLERLVQLDEILEDRLVRPVVAAGRARPGSSVVRPAAALRSGADHALLRAGLPAPRRVSLAAARPRCSPPA